MATLSQLPATLNLACTVGNDFTVTLSVLENGSTWSATGATLVTDIIARDGTVVATDFTSSATDGQVTLSLTDAQTTTLGVGVYTYRLSVTKSSLTRDWIAGTLSVVEAGSGGASSSAASLAITTGDVALSTTTLIAPSAIWDGAQSINAQTGTTYTLLTSDLGKLVTLSNASAITLTVPSGLAVSAGQRIDLAQTGAGQVTVAGSGATVNATPGLKLRAQYSAATLICTATDTYLLVGDLSA
jgi:hypothetical protein